MDSIFYFNTNTKKFHLLYNFNAKAGDTVVIHNGKFKPTKAFFSYYDSIDFFKYKVIAIDSIQLSNKWVKRQKVEGLGNSNWGFTKPTGSENDYILNKIGSITYFFGVFPGTYPGENLSILRCYNESDFEYKNPSWNQPCDIITDLPDNRFGTNDYQIYPNPCNNQLFISMSEPIESIDAYDINGLKTMFIVEYNKVNILDMSALKQGLYLFIIKTNHHIYVKKILRK